MANRSDEVRDALVAVLLAALGEEDVDPRVLAVARAYIKDNPPEEVPTPDSNTGLLDEALAELEAQEKVLPFPAKGT